MSKESNAPQFIKQLPWYAKNQSGVIATGALPNSHQTTQIPKSQSQDWYDRGKKGFQSTSFRKGACQNCGAMGHTRKQCTQRPRKLGAKFSNSNIAADDVVKNLNLGWESKRDRWNGYQSQMYKEVINEHQQFQQLKKKLKPNQDLDAQYKQGQDPMAAANLPSKLANQKFIGLSGIRIRGDMAKYLKNLDVNSTHFDPKSRSMKDEDNPFSLVALSNLQNLGQKYDLIQQDKFALEQAQKNNSQMSSIALPTLTQKIYRTVKLKNQNILSGKMKEIAQKYETQTKIRPDFTVIVQQDDQINYFGQKFQRKIVKSNYEQDVYINDHTSVWGSWYNKILGWGFACCHSTQKQSYCLGSKGKQKALAKQLKLKAQRLKELQQIEQRQQEQDLQQ